MKFAPCWLVVPAGLSWLLACTGSIGGSFGAPHGPGGGGDDGPGPGQPPGQPAAPDELPAPPADVAVDELGLCSEPAPGGVPLRRLTRNQFENAVRALFGDAALGEHGFPETALREGFRSYADINTVTADGATEIAGAAAAIAGRVTRNLTGLTGCTPGGVGDDPCVTGYLQRIARRAYRRPATPAEVETLRGVYRALRGMGYDAQAGLAGTLEVLLQSPQFLYLSELGADPEATPGSVQSLTSHEIAARLSFFLWDAPPDARLDTLADEDRLRDPDTLREEARRMLDDPRTRVVWGRFVEDWFHLQRIDGLSKNPQAFPMWNDALRADMKREAAAFANHVVFEGDGTLSTLLSAPFTLANRRLAELYGASGAGDAFTRVALDPTQRAGLLTSTAFLAAHAGSNESLPVVRGAFVRTHLLCQHLTVPEGLVFELPPADPNVRGRERFAQHRDSPACSGCHALMDPIGFGLENYDAIGRYRTHEGNDLPIDASGELADAGEISGPFVGGVELAQRLARSRQVEACAAEQLLSYALARPAGAGDACALRSALHSLRGAGGDLRELLVGVATSDAFSHRRMPEVAQ